MIGFQIDAGSIAHSARQISGQSEAENKFENGPDFGSKAVFIVGI